MSDAWKCDRCGKLYGEDETFTVRCRYEAHNRFFRDEKMVEVCPECTEKIKAYLFREERQR